MDAVDRETYKTCFGHGYSWKNYQIEISRRNIVRYNTNLSLMYVDRNFIIGREPDKS